MYSNNSNNNNNQHPNNNNNTNNSNADKLVIGEYRAIGFDVDHTLVEYKFEMELMLYDCVARYLVQYFGYSPQLLMEHSPLQTEFLSRGLLLDKARGNILKLDCFRNLAMGYYFSFAHTHPLFIFILFYIFLLFKIYKYIYKLINIFPHRVSWKAATDRC